MSKIGAVNKKSNIRLFTRGGISATNGCDSVNSAT